jgi:hypothetical protein
MRTSIVLQFMAAAPSRRLHVLIPAALLSALALAAWAQDPAADAVPRLADGHPDLNGTWDNGAGIDFVRPQQRGESICVSGCGNTGPAPAQPAGQGGPPPRPSKPTYRPEFAAKVADLSARQVEVDPVLRCFAPGVPRIGPPDKIVQRPGEIVFLYDDVSGNFFRIVPTDGRGHRTDTEPTHLGDAVGKWEGDTLVVETTQFNDETWLTDDGAFHTTDLRVVERLTRHGDTLQWTATAYDPKVLAEPWVQGPRTVRATSDELIEATPCVEQSIKHMVDGSHHPNPR